jgi:prevent-host-death family protein
LTSSQGDLILMTMVAKPRTLPAGQFKARCLSLLDEVARTGRPLVVTKRGKAVAKLVPLEPRDENPLLGSVLEERDIVSPTGDVWEAP